MDQSLAHDTETRLAEQIITHGSCRRSWTGRDRCHCAAPGCHRLFNSLSAFDRHQDGGSCARNGLVCKQGRLGEVIWMASFRESWQWLPDGFEAHAFGSDEYLALNSAACEAFAAAMDRAWERDAFTAPGVPSPRMAVLVDELPAGAR